MNDDRRAQSPDGNTDNAVNDAAFADNEKNNTPAGNMDFFEKDFFEDKFIKEDEDDYIADEFITETPSKAQKGNTGAEIEDKFITEDDYIENDFIAETPSGAQKVNTSAELEDDYDDYSEIPSETPQGGNYITDEHLKGAEDIPDDEDFDYDYGYKEEDFGDTRLVIPVIGTIIKRLIPLFIFLLILLYLLTSGNFIIKNYRENFLHNISMIAEDAGLKAPQTTESEDAAETDENTDVIEYKEQAAEQTTESTAYRTSVVSDTMISFEGASESKFVKYGDGVVCAATNYICYINIDGTIEWEKNIPITDPILKAEGDYFVVAQKNGTKFTMYKGNTVITDKDAENNILSANVSSKGDVVLVTEKTGFKGAVAVYNRYGDKAFEWSSGSSVIMSADISSMGRRVAVGLVNTDNEVKSAVYLFNMKKTESYAKEEFDESLIYNVDFKGSYLNVFADNALTVLKSSGKKVNSIAYEDFEVTRASIADDGSKTVLFTGTNIPMINIYSKNGKLKDTVSVNKVPDFAYITDDGLVYNIDREIISGKTNRRIPYKYTAIMDIKGIVPVNEKSFLVIYSNSVSMIQMEGLLW